MSKIMWVKALVLVVFLIGNASGDISDVIARAEDTPRAVNDRFRPPRCKRNEAGEIVYLNLDYVSLQPADLQDVASCTKLESLSLARTNVTDEQLKMLVELKCLKALSLNHTGIGDEGLKHLGQMRSLKSLCLAEVEATSEGVKRLRHELPKLQVGYFQRQPAGKQLK